MAEKTIANMVSPKVGVVMATYNGERFLSQQIDSILAQQGVDVFLYVRDDRSSDQTVSLINTYHEKTGRVFLLETLPVQSGVTKNFFSIVRDIDLSGMDYMAYSDQDDIWLPGKLITAVSRIRSRSVSCYASNLLMGDKDAKVIGKKSILARLAGYIFNYKTNKQTKYDHYFEAASAGCTLVLNRSAALYFQSRIRQLLDRIPSDASHDWSTYALTRLHGFEWYIDNDAYIIYRQHTENAYGANIGMAGVTKLIDLFRSGWYRRHILMIDELYNEENSHPAFIETIRSYNPASFFSRWKVAVAISGYRRKFFHRAALFGLVLLGYFK